MPAPKYPPVPAGTTRITTSTAEKYLGCGVLFELEKDATHRWATVAMAIGTAVSIGAEEDNRSKLRGGEGIKLLDLVDASVEGYVREVEECEVPASKFELAQGKDDSAAAARAYGMQVSPNVQGILAAEEPIVAQVSEGFELAGKPDVFTCDGVGDTKVGRARTQEEADRSRQLSIGGLLYYTREGRFPRRVWFDSIAKGRNGYQATRLYSHRSGEDYARTLFLLDRVRQGIERGVFLPPPEFGAWRCSKTWCAHYGRDCPVTGKGLIR
jgi:hypothetical protein